MNIREITSASQESPVDQLPPPPIDKFRGCILGCAFGDAVGAWAERRSSAEAKDYAKYFIPKLDFSIVTPHHGGMPFGQYTDDTQLTRELVLSIVDEGEWCPEEFGRRIARAFEQDEVVGGGRATAEAASRLSIGVPWDESGTPPPRAGNGAAMRAGPIGLLYWDDVEGLVRAAKEQAVITHAAEMAVAGSVAVAAAVAMCLNASKLTSAPHEPGWWAWLARTVERYSPEFAKDIAELSRDVFRERKKGRKAASDEEWNAVRLYCVEGDQSGWDGISPWSRSSVLWSLYCLMTHPKDLVSAVALAVMPGGDVDTTAAMVGTMVGAHVGLDGFPAEAVEKVAPLIHDARSPRYDWAGLRELADLLHEVVVRRHQEAVEAQTTEAEGGQPEDAGEPPEGAEGEQATVLDLFYGGD